MGNEMTTEVNKIGYWHNFRTGEGEYREAPKDFSDYVPQIGGRGLYQLYVEHKGMGPLEAALKVLSLCVGEEIEA